MRAEARGAGLGRMLTDAIVGAARRIGYREMRLDTLESMAGPIRLYEAMGFRRIPAYYAPTPPGTLFMALDPSGRATRPARRE